MNHRAAQGIDPASDPASVSRRTSPYYDPASPYYEPRLDVAPAVEPNWQTAPKPPPWVSMPGQVEGPAAGLVREHRTFTFEIAGITLVVHPRQTSGGQVAIDAKIHTRFGEISVMVFMAPDVFENMVAFSQYHNVIPRLTDLLNGEFGMGGRRPRR